MDADDLRMLQPASDALRISSREAEARCDDANPQIGRRLPGDSYTPIRKGNRARLIAISGIDSSGKGYTACSLAGALRSEGASVALIGIDGWLNLPTVRFSTTQPGQHFYQNAFFRRDVFRSLSTLWCVTAP